MPLFMCATCGTQYPESPEPPGRCPICEDERQWVPESGQEWTTREALAKHHEVIWEEEEKGLYSLTVDPHFAIGQRAFLIQHEEGNILWDCLSLIDSKIIKKINALGGVSVIAISHPHYYSSMLDWSAAFSGAPVLIHADDAKWVQRSGKTVHPWSGERHAVGAATMVRCGGHFDGASVLHCPWLAGGKGALMSGDTIQVVPDRTHVSFMYSYPNLIPLDSARVRRIVEAVEPFEFDRIYGAFGGRTVGQDGKNVVRRSAERYIDAIGGNLSARS